MSDAECSEDSGNKKTCLLAHFLDWDVFTWRIPNLLSIPYEVDHAIQSPPFTFKDAVWNLKLYPFGQSPYDSHGFVDILMERLDTEQPKHDFLCIISHKNANGVEVSKKLQFVFDAELIFSDAFRFMRSPKESELGDVFILEFQFKVPERSEYELDHYIQSVKSMKREKYSRYERLEYLEIGEVFEEYTECRSFLMKTCSLPFNPPDDYLATSVTFSFAKAKWILKVRPYFQKPSTKQNVCMILERLESDVYDHNIVLKLCLFHPYDKIHSGSFFFDLSHTEQEVFHFQRAKFFPYIFLEVVLKIKIAAVNLDKGNGSTSGSCGVLHNLKHFFLNKEDSDVIIKVQGQEFPAHRLILKAQSPVLAAAFRNDMKEKTTGIVDIEDCDPSIFSDFLCFLYCGEVANLCAENVFSLFTLGDKYEVPGLMMKCVEFMKQNLSISSICDTIALALLHSETELIKLSTNFFTKNVQRIITTDKWESFEIENPKESSQLKALVSNKKLKTSPEKSKKKVSRPRRKR